MEHHEQGADILAARKLNATWSPAVLEKMIGTQITDIVGIENISTSSLVVGDSLFSGVFLFCFMLTQL